MQPRPSVLYALRAGHRHWNNAIRRSGDARQATGGAHTDQTAISSSRKYSGAARRRAPQRSVPHDRTPPPMTHTKRDALRRADVQQYATITIVVVHHIAAVGFHRVRARALMEQRAHGAKRPACKALDEFGFVEIIVNLASSRFLNLSARVKLSTAMMPRSPRAESA